MMPQTALPAETEWRAEKDVSARDDSWLVINRVDGKPSNVIVRGLTEVRARLIAAAPELADALAKANAVLSGIGESWPDFFTGKSVALARVPEDVKAALTKAGRAPQ